MPDKAAASRRTPKRWRACRAHGRSRSVWSSQARLRFISARRSRNEMREAQELRWLQAYRCVAPR